MSIKDTYNNKKVIFSAQDGLEDMIYRLTIMMSKLPVSDEETNKQFKTKIYGSKKERQNKKFP